MRPARWWHQWWWFSIVLVFILVKLSMVPEQPFLNWDEAVYVGLSKYLWSGGDVGLFEPFRPLALPLLLGITYRSVVLTKLFMLAVSILVVAVTYQIAKEYGSAPGRIVPLILLSPLFFKASDLVMTELLSALFGLIGFWFFLRGRTLWAGIFLGVACTARYPAGLFFGALLFSSLLSRTRQACHLTLGFFGVVLPYLLYLFLLTGGGVENILNAASHQNNPVHAQAVLYYVQKLLTYSPMMLLLFFGFVNLQFSTPRKVKEVSLLALFLLPLLYLSFIGNKQERFILMIIPFGVLIAARGWAWLADNTHTSASKIIGKLFIGALLLSAGFQVVYSIQPSPSVPQELKQIAAMLNAYPGKGVLTTTPLFTPYTEKLFFPLYYKHETAHSRYQYNKAKTGILIFNHGAFACGQYPEKEKKECAEHINQFWASLHTEREAVLHGSIDGDEYDVFMKPSLAS